MDIPVIECVAGTTLRMTARLQDGIADDICSLLIVTNSDGLETVVNSRAAISSGNGLYYAPHYIPRSDAWYVNEWQAKFGVNTYVARQYVRADMRSA